MKKKFTGKIALILAACSIVGLSGCSGQSASSGAAAGSSSAATEYEDTVNIGLAGDPAYLDPDQSSIGPTEATVMQQIYQGLVTTSADSKSIEPDLAKDWKISDDGLTYTFNLKPGIKFSDGTPVKPKDWVWSLTRARDCDTSEYRFIADEIRDVKADEKTVTITLKYQWAPFLADLCNFNMVVGCKAYYDKVGGTQYAQKPLGTGPYMLKEWVKGSTLTLVKNPNYAESGYPKTSTLKFTVIPDDNTRLMQLQSGQLDVVGDVPYSQVETIQKDQNLKVQTFKSTQIRYLILNTTKKPLDNLKVRQAILYATNKQEIANLVATKYGQPVASVLSESQGKWFNSDLKVTNYDPEKAKELLKEAGFPNGVTLTISVSSGSQVYQQIATLLKSEWEKAGITVNIELLEKAALSNKFQSLQHQATVLQWVDDIMDPSEVSGWIADYDQSHAWYTGLKDQALDDLNAQASKEMDETKRLTMYKEIQQKISDNANVIPLFRNDFVYATSNKIQNLEVSPFSVMRLKDIQKTK
ncbi:ABC transporter substrate-binding protein [Caproicibacter sp.]|uniref:ABC transporter substrate-binding protein n=1 Tax=Caproicibacter sp. TaxID=2814884 RepID=UPI003989EB38